MPLVLPEPLPRYFAAQNALDADGMTACFAKDAVVHDEGGTYVGRDAIRGWKRDTIAKYGISIDPLEVGHDGDKTVVVARVAGNFPGSPANLTYSVRIAPDGLIRTLDIS
jgi:ketosteroid isomerase-like protein